MRERGIRVFLATAASIKLAINFSLAGFIFSKLSDSLETESMSVMDYLRADITKEFNKTQIVRLLSRRRSVRFGLGR